MPVASAPAKVLGVPPGLEQANFLSSASALQFRSPPGLVHGVHGSSHEEADLHEECRGDEGQGPTSHNPDSSPEAFVPDDLDALSTDELISLLFDKTVQG